MMMTLVAVALFVLFILLGIAYLASLLAIAGALDDDE